MEPVSIRYKNPGAMWPGDRATKWGSTTWVQLKDAQKNKIAVFSTFVQGAAAQFDLWATKYTGVSLKADIAKWSGHNSPASYVKFLEDATGISIDTIISKELLASPAGWKLLKAQSHWEAGKPIPMTDEEWQQAQAMVFKSTPVEAIVENFNAIVQLGSTGDSVNKLQRLLGCKETGTYQVSSETEFALKLFQIRHGLLPDGVCGQLTWEKLNSKTSW